MGLVILDQPPYNTLLCPKSPSRNLATAFSILQQQSDSLIAFAGTPARGNPSTSTLQRLTFPAPRPSLLLPSHLSISLNDCEASEQKHPIHISYTHSTRMPLPPSSACEQVTRTSATPAKRSQVYSTDRSSYALLPEHSQRNRIPTSNQQKRFRNPTSQSSTTRAASCCLCRSKGPPCPFAPLPWQPWSR